jgi:DNA-binding MarR family transcriptional regulator
MPAYLRRFDDAKPLLENVARECLRPEGYLFDEVQFLLRSELSNPATYNSILAAIARGNTKVGDIALDVGVDSTTANKYLTTLRELSLVEREVPLTDPDPLRSRRGTYRVADRFLAFHFRHIQPHAGLVNSGRGARVLEQFVQPDLERLYDEARVEFVLAHLKTGASDLIGDEIVETGRFDGACVRAVARTSEGAGVAAIVVPRNAAGKPELDRSVLEAEIARLRPAFGRGVVRLSYALTDKPARPLEVTRMTEGKVS